MATISNKFLYFATKAGYTEQKEAKNIAPGSIVFVNQPAVAADPANNKEAIPAECFIETHGKQWFANFSKDDIKNAIEALDVTNLTNSDTATKGVTITINEVNGKITSVDITDLGGGKLVSYTKGSDDSAIAAGDTIAAALAKLENQIANKIGALDSDVSAGDNKYFTGIELKDGKLVGVSEAGSKTTVANVDTAKVVDYVESNSATAQDIDTTDTIAQALAKVKRNVEVEVADREAAITAAIQGLDGTTVTAGNGEFIKSISETDGIVSATTGEMPTVAEISGTGQAIIAISQTKGTIAATAGDIASAHVTYTPQGEEGAKDTNKTNIQETTKEIYGKIRDLTASSALTLVDANDGPATTVKADGTTYKLKQGTSVVAQFNIMKETFLDTSATGLVWFKTAPSEFATTGNTQGESTPAEYAEWNAAEKKAAVAYLKLVMRTDADGDSGTTGDTTVNAYIPAASLIATYTGAAASDGVITVAVSDANVITATIGDGTVALAKLTTAAQNTLSSYKTTISTTVSGGNHITITKTAGNESNGTGDSYAITESNIADADDLAAEITARKAVDGQSGDTYTANSGTNYISSATSLNSADILLDTQAKANADNISAEETRAKSAEVAIDSIVGLSKDENSETRTYTNEGNYIGKLTSPNTNTIKSDISALDTQAKANADDIATLNGSDSTTGSVAKKIKDAIGGLDAEITSATGTFARVTVTETDGKITGVTVADGDADDIKISADYTKSTGTTIAAVAPNDSIETAIEKVEGKIDNLNTASPFEYTNASNKSTVLKGSNLTAQNVSEVAVGQYNVSTSGKTQFSVGIGAANAQKNGIEIQNDGTIIIYPYKTTNNVKSFDSTSAILQEILSNEIDWYEGN